MVSEVDDYVGQILNHLEDTGLAQNTIVIFISDHGEYLGDYHTYGKGAPGNDCISRVPCIVRWPEGVASGTTVSGLTEALDILPTILDLCGISHRYVCHQDGKELLFDHESDPNEYSDISDSPEYATILADLRHQMCQRLLNTPLPKRREWAY